MLFKQIKYFVSVVENNSFTEAAEKCFISQSAISQQIQALEKEIDAKLIEREGRKIKITNAGEYFYRHSLILLDETDRLVRETVKIANQNNKQLKIGYLKGNGGSDLQKAVSEFSKKYPDIEISIISGNHEDLYNALKSNSVDMVINDQRRAFSDEYINHLLVTRYCYAEVSGNSSLSGLDKAEISELKNIPCILLVTQQQKENECEFYRDVIGFKGDFIFAESIEEGRLMVSANKGFMPVELNIDDCKNDGIIYRIQLLRDNKPIKRNYCAFWKKTNTSSYTEEFTKTLSDILE